MRKINKQSGQVLLIAVMLVAVLLTVVFSASFVSRTDTQISKLEEENQKALAAAEAGIEAALKGGSIADFSGLNVPQGFTGSANVSSASSSTFVTPLIQRDHQYTFYLSNPGGTVDNPDFSSLYTAYNNQTLTLCSSSISMAMAATFIKQNGTIKRFIINPPDPPDPPTRAIVANAPSANGAGVCPSDQTYAYQHRLSSTDVGNSNIILIVRFIGTANSAKIGITGSSVLPIQGKTIVSKAKSPTGVTKIVQLFQSYPQIPSEFFVTSF